jgi:superfamily II DNA or RNA helicase
VTENREQSEATKLQDKVIGGALSSLEDGKDVFISAPTGAGKTRKFSVIASERSEEGDRILILAHRRNLIRQAANNMEKWGNADIEISVGMNGQLDQTGQVVYSTVQTAQERINDLEAYDVAIIDEAHHGKKDNTLYRETIETLINKNPDIQFVFLSATPPEGYEGLHPRMKEADKYVITFEEALQAKLIDLPETVTPRMVYENHETVEDIVEKHRKNKTGTDLESGIGRDLGKIRDEDWSYQLVNVYERYLEDRKTLAFFDSIKEANAFAKEASDRGHPVEVMHSGFTDEQNERKLDFFRESKKGLLVSVDMINEGVDVDADGILLDKKTTSATEYKQIVGRESRSHGEDKKRKSLLVDTGASTLIHGNITAQADLQTVRGKLETKVVSGKDLLPDTPGGGFKPWVSLATSEKNDKVWGTSIDGAVVYAIPTEKGYAAFMSSNSKKGSRVDLLQIEGERKGMPSAEALSDWIAQAVQRNERNLARLVGSTKGSETKLDQIVKDDWERNGSSIEQSVKMMMAYARPAAMINRQGAMAR